MFWHHRQMKASVRDVCREALSFWHLQFSRASLLLSGLNMWLAFLTDECNLSWSEESCIQLVNVYLPTFSETQAWDFLPQCQDFWRFPSQFWIISKNTQGCFEEFRSSQEIDFTPWCVVNVWVPNTTLFSTLLLTTGKPDGNSFHIYIFWKWGSSVCISPLIFCE